MKKLNLFLMLCVLCGSMYGRAASEWKTASPNKRVAVTVQPDGARWTYSVSFDGRERITASTLGFTDEGGAPVPSAEWTVGAVERHKQRSQWRPLWGKRTVVADRYNELVLPLAGADGGQLTVTLRAYDDGVAIRYDVKPTAKRLREATDYRFADNYYAWYYNGESPNIEERVADSRGERRPIVVLNGDGCYMALHEACLTEGEPLKFRSEQGEQALRTAMAARDMAKGYTSGWRVVMCAEGIGTLVDSHLIELLNPEPQAGADFSWVKPGVTVWDWRIDGAVWGDFHYTMSYPSWVRMIDFAARQGIAHLVLDANWYGPEFARDSDPLKGDKASDVRNIIKYGREKGVGVWLYLNDVGGTHYPIEETLKQYGEWGAAGVKYGFMGGSPEEKNHKTRRITELCAQNKLLIDFHDDPVHPYGQMRTWPNAVTREYCKAQLDGHDIFFPKTFVTAAFVNTIAGPLDMNNGFFDLRQGRTTRKDNNQEVPSTVVSEAARTQIIFSGATVIPDIPEYYERYPSLLRFIAAQQQPWRESKTLGGEIGQYIATMRQSAKGDYLVGVATNEEARTVQVPLSFLPKGEWSAEVTEDGEGAHYLTSRETTRISTRTVTRRDVLTVNLAPGGGACILIKKK